MSCAGIGDVLSPHGGCSPFGQGFTVLRSPGSLGLVGLGTGGLKAAAGCFPLPRMHATSEPLSCKTPPTPLQSAPTLARTPCLLDVPSVLGFTFIIFRHKFLLKLVSCTSTVESVVLSYGRQVKVKQFAPFASQIRAAYTAAGAAAKTVASTTVDIFLQKVFITIPCLECGKKGHCRVAQPCGIQGALANSRHSLSPTNWPSPASATTRQRPALLTSDAAMKGGAV